MFFFDDLVGVLSWRTIISLHLANVTSENSLSFTNKGGRSTIIKNPNVQIFLFVLLGFTYVLPMFTLVLPYIYREHNLIIILNSKR